MSGTQYLHQNDVSCCKLNMQVSDEEISNLYIKARFFCDVAAFNQLNEVAKDGNVLSVGFLSIIYFRGCFICSQDKQKAASLAAASYFYITTIDDDDVCSKFKYFILGMMIEFGILPIQQPASCLEALRCFEISSELGYSEAQRCIGVTYSEDTSIPNNKEKAFQWFQTAANNGSICAHNNIAHCYLEGEGVIADPVKAVEHFTITSNAGLVCAYHDLGQCYEKGLGVEVDTARAAELYTRAVEFGCTDAISSLATLKEKMGV